MSGGPGWTLLNGSPLWIAVLAAVAALAAVSGWLSSRRLPAGRRAVVLAVRAAALAAAAMAVLRPAREIDLTRVRRVPLVVLVDTSRSMLLGPAPPAAGARAWLREWRDRLGQLGAWYDVRLMGLGDPVEPLEGEGDVRFDRESSPLGSALEEIARTAREVGGVVLLSDGRDTERPGDPPQGLPFPVYPVVLSEAAVPDLWIERVEVPPVAFIRTPVEIRVLIGRTGLGPGPCTVSLLEEGRPVRTETVDLAGPVTEAVLSFTPQRTGRRAYRVELEARPEEATLANNRAQFRLSVIRDKTRVLLVAGTPTWDVKFLRRRLRQDPGVDLITFLILRTPRDLSLVPQDELSLIPFPTQELFGKELPSFDVVIFANFDYAPYVPRRYLENLVRFVREDGGGFVMLGGDRSFGLGGYRGSPLEAILPFDLSGMAPGQAFLPGPFRPQLNDTRAAHPLFQWRPDPDEKRALWGSLPPLEGMNWVLWARPEALVLAENPERRNEYGPLPVVAVAEPGRGRVLAVATDTLWHWALPYVGAGGEDAVYRDFWTRALRWLVHDPELELVRLAPPAGPVRAGAEVRFGARVLDRMYRPATGAALEGALVDEAGERLPLGWTEAAPGEYRSEPVRFPAPGLWRVEVEARQGGAFLGRDRLGVPVEPASPEDLRVGVDLEYLERLAQASGGRIFRPADRGLMRILRERGEARVEVVGRRVEEVWPRPGLLLLTVALFGMDWTLRRFWT